MSYYKYSTHLQYNKYIKLIDNLWYNKLKQKLNLLEDKKIIINLSELNVYLYKRYLYETNEIQIFNDTKYNLKNYMQIIKYNIYDRYHGYDGYHEYDGYHGYDGYHEYDGYDRHDEYDGYDEYHEYDRYDEYDGDDESCKKKENNYIFLTTMNQLANRLSNFTLGY